MVNWYGPIFICQHVLEFLASILILNLQHCGGRMPKVQIIDVFTPSRPARAAFVERKSINDKLVNAIQTPGKQIVVYGHSGSGKTTLLENKLCQLYENHLITRCMSGMTFEQILRDAFDQLDQCYKSAKKVKSSSSKSADFSKEYFGIKAKINIAQKKRNGN